MTLDTKDKASAPPQGLRIGGVARATGLSTSTIRAWERRYEAIAPHRTASGYRIYDAETVERLGLLQTLRERGEPLPSIARCTTHVLRQRAAAGRGRPSAGSSEVIEHRMRVGLLHRTLPGLIETYASGTLPFEVVWSAADLQLADTETRPACDLLVVQLDLLGESPVRRLRDLGAESMAFASVVETGFTKRGTLQQLAHAGYKTAQGPVTLTELSELITQIRADGRRHDTPEAPRAEVPPPRFASAELSSLREMSTSIECECPRHLAALVMQLVAFEEYSKTCHDEQPEEAALHAELARETGLVRSRVEAMLVKVCEAEGALLPQS